MRKFLAPCWPRVTAESRVAEGRANPVNVLNMRENSSNCSTDQISLLNGEFCLLTGSSASFQQWLQSGSSVSFQRLVCLFPEHTRSPHWRHISSVMFQQWPWWTLSTWTLFFRVAWLWDEPLFPSICDPKLWLNPQELFSGCAAWTGGPLGDEMGWATGLACLDCVEKAALSEFWLIWEKAESDIGFHWALPEPLCLTLVTELLSWCLTGLLCSPILVLWNENTSVLTCWV